MSYIPQANATLTQLIPQGSAEDYDQPEADGTPLWEGEQECFVSQKQQTVYAAEAGEMRYISTVTLYVSLDWAGPLPITVGQYLTFTTGGSDNLQRHRIMEMNYPVLAEQGPLAALTGQTLTINLDPTPIEVEVPID